MIGTKNIRLLLLSLSTALLLQSSVILNGITPAFALKVKFEPPKSEPAPKITIGGGRRDNGTCDGQSNTTNSRMTGANTAEKLTALLPSTHLGLTLTSHPTFLVYVPKTSAKVLEFTLEDEAGEGIYQTKINLKGVPGIVSFSLPKTEPALEVGKDYRWVVSIICQQTGPTNPFIEGLVRRSPVNATLTNRINKAKPLEQIVLYSQSGYWFEALTNLANLRLSQPQNREIKTAWNELLESVDLNAIANAPLQK
ncbi:MULTISPECIES: DUF928 domain-containing protein [Nostocales]|uniref:DUF928 domain-containing protein n=3 Tax=Nostocales TaxID=1161 RepID=A0A0C1RB22_9CYAN|nr:DUF928 domain-containing protein [Tolypothrix bouteillei]KAF3888243.1 DUF928 domain-containing protein [Tolypothrix bouteillei VB521301]